MPTITINPVEIKVSEKYLEPFELVLNECHSIYDTKTCII